MLNAEQVPTIFCPRLTLGAEATEILYSQPLWNGSAQRVHSTATVFFPFFLHLSTYVMFLEYGYLR